MVVTVKLRYLRMSPRKVRLVANLIRGKKIDEAQGLLNFANKRAALPLVKLLKSAYSTAENDFRLDKSNLYISKIVVDEGPTLKRGRHRARGRIFPIAKRTSHIALSLEEIEPGKKIGPKKQPELKEAKAIQEKVPKKEIKPEVERQKREQPYKEKRPEKGKWWAGSRLGQTAKKIFRRKAF